MIITLSQLRLLAVFVWILSVSATSCKKEIIPDFEPGFTFVVSDDNPNTLRFKNSTTGEHGYMSWDFGNGEITGKTPANKLTYTVNYPLAGEYPVTLTIWGPEGKEEYKESYTETVSIARSELAPGFNVEPGQSNENYILLTDTSQGDPDYIIWKVCGREIHADAGSDTSVYLAMAGLYDITLEIYREDEMKSLVQEFRILSSDPDYMNHYELIWSDEFDNPELDVDKWKHEVAPGGWVNNELQSYTDGDNTSISNGSLVISTELVGPGQNLNDYTSSRLNSKESFTYGRFEIRAKMPDYKGPGLWPALWMLGESIHDGTSWPLCGEIDIMEYVSWDPDHVSCAIHTQDNNHTLGNNIGSGHQPLESAEEEYHIYGLIWTYTGLKFYIDNVDNVKLTYNKPGTYTEGNWPFNKPFFILLNQAVGGMYGGVQGVDDTIFPAELKIDYVRVYQLR